MFLRSGFMANFRPHRRCAFLAGFALLSLLQLAGAQQQPAGFAVERLYQSAPGGGWFVMDDLNIGADLGGAISVSSGYARNPLVISSPDSAQKLAVVSQDA